MAEKIHQLIIIGSGPAGLTAGIYAGRANLEPIIIDGSKPGGQLMGTTLVENWPGEKSIMGPELMMRMRSQAEHCGARFVPGDVEKADLSQRPFTLWTTKGEKLQAKSIIIASGSTPLKLNCPGEEQYWGRGVSTCPVCDGAFYKNKKVVIVGGGDSAMEAAQFMTNFTKHITIVHIKEALTASAAMQEKVISNPDITFIYNSTVSAINGDGTHITGVEITNQQTKAKTTLATDGVFITIGLKPNTNPFKGQLETTPYGYIKVTDHTKTSVEGVFAAGDVFDDRYKQAIVAAGSGCKAALDAERYLKD